MHKYLFLAVLFFYSLISQAQDQVYELRTYEVMYGKNESLLHNYFENALIPALNRQGINQIGVFEEYAESLPKKIYLLIPFEDVNVFQNSKSIIEKDPLYLKEAKEYFTATEDEMPFNSISTNLIKASWGFPNLVNPIKGSEFFELRIYKSATEDALRRKVKMFNESEFEIFEEVGLPMVFFGANIAGDYMPSLTYLLAFKDKDAHTLAWKKFGPHPEWQRIIKLEEYQNTINGIQRVFLTPLGYSQL